MTIILIIIRVKNLIIVPAAKQIILILDVDDEDRHHLIFLFAWGVFRTGHWQRRDPTEPTRPDPPLVIVNISLLVLVLDAF